MRRSDFARSIMAAAKGEVEKVWEKAKCVKDRATMVEFEKACAALGKGIGAEALKKGLECIEGKRRAVRCSGCGRKMERSWQERSYCTLAGDVQVKRWYYYCRWCRKGAAPLDEWIEGEAGRLSLGVQEKLCELSNQMSYQETSKKLERLCDLRLSATAVWQHTVRWSRRSCSYRSEGAGWSDEVNLSVDAAKVNTVEKGWRDIKLAVFEDATTKQRRYAAQIGPSRQWGRKLRGVAASLGIRDTTQMRIWADGAKWIWKLAEKSFPGAQCILDFYHAMENMGAYARSVFGEGSREGAAWLQRMGHMLKTKGGEAVYQKLCAVKARRKAHRKAKKKLLKYFRPLLGYMDYPSYIREDLAIGSGIVESACKQIVQERLKRGRRWLTRHALGMATMRGLFLSNQWDTFWKQQLQCA